MRIPAGPPLTAQLGQYDLYAYIASQDYTVYALDILPGRILWRFVGSGPIVVRPSVDDDSVFVTPEGAGLYRIGRVHGETIWRRANAERFLASNQKLVYATDKLGHLLVLDRATGDQLGSWPGARDFIFPGINDLTDRVYMASNNGLVISLHDRHLVRPLRMKKLPTTATPAAQDAKKPAPAPDASKP